MTQTTTPQFVTADTMIGDAVMRYPVTAEIMLSYGLHCVGCHVSGVESIRQGAMGHGGMDEEDVQELVQEMNQAIAEREGVSSDSQLIITKRAALKIKEFAREEEKQEGIFLRAAVTPGGCSGFSYSLDFDWVPKDTDLTMDAEGFPVRIPADSVDFLKGAILDYIDGLNGSGIQIRESKCFGRLWMREEFLLSAEIYN